MKLVIVRSTASVVSSDSYNVQEIGLAKALLVHGITTEIIMSGESAKGTRVVVASLGNSSVAITRLPCKKLPGNQGLFSGICKVIERAKPDILQVNEDSQFSSAFLCLWARSKKLPVILWQGMYESYKEPLPAIMQWAYDSIVLPLVRNKYSHCIAKTARAADYLKSKGFRNVSVCPIGLDEDSIVDNGNFTISYPQGYRAYSKITPKSSSVLLYVGVFEKRRNLLFMVDVVRELIKRNVPVHLHMIGDGPQKSDCIQYLESLGLSNYVEIFGKIPQSQLSQIYGSADLFLLPSQYEIYGMVVLESMYFGLPVISSPTAGPEEIIDNHEDGIIVDELSVFKWADAIESTLNDHCFRSYLSENARKKVIKEYLWTVACTRYAEVYKRVVDVERTACH